MAYDRYLIAPINSGLDSSLRSWLIPEDAFEKLNNAYVFRGRLRKRVGSKLMGYGGTASLAPLLSKLRTRTIPSYPIPGGAGVGITDGVGAATGTLATPPFVANTLHDKFVIGSGGQVFEVTSLGTPTTMTTSGAGTGTLNTTTGDFTFVGCTPGKQIYYYQAAATDTTDGSGDADGIVPGGIFKVGQQFSIGSEIYTVYQLGTPGDMLITGTTTLARFNTTTGEYFFTGAAHNTAVYFYPSEPVMGITQYETQNTINNPTYAFDTQFAYIFSGGFWQRQGTAVWNNPAATVPHFFWAANWNGLTPDLTYLFATNFQAALGAVAATDDPARYWTGAAWADFTPDFIAGVAPQPRIYTARIILPFKDHLVLLNTIEQNAAHNTNTQYPNRCRFSHNGSPVAASAFLEPNQAGATGGGFVDAPTEEEIISAEFIKDRLIVYFEKSTWELAYTGNYVLPFVWQKLNTELGSIALLSSVPFDQEVLTIGTTGVHSCNGSNVLRIDNKIPDTIFSLRNSNNGVYRVSGIRDFFTELVYWTFPTLENEAGSDTYVNKLLVYNYRNQTWAFFDDSFTTFGYFEQQQGQTWASSTQTWQQAQFAWNSGVTQAQFRRVVAGNQQGFIVELAADTSVNAPALEITNITQVGANIVLTIIDHTLFTDDYIKIENCLGFTALNDNNYAISVVDKDNISIGLGTVSGTYLGGGTVRRVSYIDILTKRLNPYAQQGKNVYLAKLDFAVQKTTSGAITVDYYPSSTDLSMVTAADNTGMIMGTGVLETFPYALKPIEQAQSLLWHAVYLQCDGEFIQLNLYLDEAQMLIPAVVESGLEIEGIVLFTMPVTRLG